MAQKPRGRSTAREREPVLLVARPQFHQEIKLRLDLGQRLLDCMAQSPDDLESIERDFSTWDKFNEQLLKRRFSIFTIANDYRRGVRGFGGVSSPEQETHRIRTSIDGQMRKLESVLLQLELYTSDVEEDDMARPGIPQGTKVFIVHGHDGDVKYRAVEFLEKITGQRPVVLHEQPDSGRTIIEKFEDHASEAGFAVVLLTADDEGRAKVDPAMRPRARQNVVFELGFFIGRLGRGRVVALYEVDVELPSDLTGVLYTPLSGNWHTALAGELRAAKITVDLSKAI